MKAIVRDNYGPPDVLELEDLSKPEPGGDGVLLRVHATSVNPADWHILRGDPYVSRLQLGLRSPSMYVSRKTSWHQNRPRSRSSRRRPYPWPRRRPCRACAITDGSNQGRGS